MLAYFAKHTASVKDDVLSGLTVSLALVPEAVAFAFVAGVLRPLVSIPRFLSVSSVRWPAVVRA